MTGPPVSQEDVNTLTLIKLLITDIFPSPRSSGAVKLGRMKSELGVVEYRAKVTGYYLTNIIEVQVAHSRSEALLKLLEAVEDFNGETTFANVSDETESEEDYAEEQPPGKPKENEDEEDFKKIMQQMSRGAAEDEYDLLTQQITQQKGS